MAIEVTAADKFATVNGLRLHYLDWGDPGAPAIVMLHGLRSFAHTFDGVARPLADRYRVISLDQRGRGESDWDPAGSYNTEAYVSDLEQLVELIGLDRFVLLGHSMGGGNTIAYTARHPEQVVKAVIEDSGPATSPPAPGVARISREMESTPAHFASWAEAEAFARQLRPTATAETIQAALDRGLKALPDGTVTWRYDFEGIRQARQRTAGLPTDDRWAAVRALECPTLVLRGANSDILAAATAQAMADANPNIRWVEIPDAGHPIHDDNLPAYNHAVAEFLAE